MSISKYELLSILQTREGEEGPVREKGLDYMTVLETVRSAIAQNHAQELSAALDDAAAASTLRDRIMQYTAEAMAGQDYDRQELTERIYQDMAGLGILTPYLYDPAVEEININGYSTIEIIRRDRTGLSLGDWIRIILGTSVILWIGELGRLKVKG